MTQDGDLILASHTHAIDEVGIITKGGEYDPKTGEVITPPVVFEGYHVNFAGEPPESWDPYLIIVNTASRVFAGDSSQAPDTFVLEEMIL